MPFCSRSLLAAIVFECLVAAGCGPGGPKVVKVNGTVTRGGQPLKDIRLTFFPEQGRPSSALTDAEGRFSLQYTPDRPGAVVGKHKVTAWYRPEDPGSLRAMETGKLKTPPAMLAVQAKYGKRETTPLTIDVQGSQSLELKLD